MTDARSTVTDESPAEERSTDVPEASEQQGLDALVTRVAVHLMSVSRSSLRQAIAWTLQTLGEALHVDTVFLRRHDHERGVSILVDEWPHREHVPDPDPLGIVPFEADPVFAASRTLREPLVVRPSTSGAEYQDRVEEAAGVGEVAMATVPLVQNEVTKGVLGFVNFGDRAWTTAETNALQAIASLVVQLEARVAAEDRLHYNALHDELTGLPNRRALFDEMERRLAHDDGAMTTVLYLDLDHFKTINDVLGHPSGDRLLEILAQRLRGALRPDDFIARLGGDEFVVLMGGSVDPLAAQGVAERLLRLVARPVDMDGYVIHRTASVGIAAAGSGEESGEELLAHADAALYSAKAHGRSRAVVFDDALQQEVDRRFSSEMMLRAALDTDRIALHYQPEVDLRDGRLLAVEGLLRWHHPARGLLPAGEFITLAEETGLIVELGRWVLAEAGKQMARWVRENPTSQMVMRINVSPTELMRRDLVTGVAECLAKNDLPPSRLCLEITEHAVLQSLDSTLLTLNDLRALGVELVIDDFGIGYSSMVHLKHLPVTGLKIAQDFVTELGADSRDRAIVESVVRLATSFDLDLIAEGVETPDHVRELLALGCTRGQGFLISKPMPAATLEPLIFGHEGELPWAEHFRA